MPQYPTNYFNQNPRYIIEYLIEKRTSLGLTQKEIARRMNCGQSRVSKMESAKDKDLKLGDIGAYATAVENVFYIEFKS